LSETHKPAITAAPRSSRSEFWRGVRDTLPLEIGAIPFGIIFGALAISAGISTGGTIALSLFVFAGSSQFIAAGLFAEGASPAVIILTTAIVNLRHVLYGITLGPHLRRLPQAWLIPLGFWLTDESFVITARRYAEPDPPENKHWYFLGSEIFMYANWQLCTWIGIAVGNAIPDTASWGLDFAMSVTFIGMVVSMITSRPILAAVAVGALTAVLAHGFPNQLGLLTGSLAGVAAGLITERRLGEQADG
jgi:4-azaleucine resistance transporter AzlC